MKQNKFIRGTSSRRTPSRRRSRGPNAPLRSGGTRAFARVLVHPGDLRPAGPPLAVARGAPTPRSAPAAHARSPACSFSRATFVPPDPLSPSLAGAKPFQRPCRLVRWHLPDDTGRGGGLFMTRKLLAATLVAALTS